MKRTPATSVSDVRKRHQAFLDSFDVFIKSYLNGSSARPCEDASARCPMDEAAAKVRR